jgi:hypothetical protein
VVRSPVAEEGHERGEYGQGRDHHGEVQAGPAQERRIPEADLLEGQVERLEEGDVAEGDRPVDQQPEERQHADQIQPRGRDPAR